MKTTVTLFQSLVLFVSLAAPVRPSSNTIIPSSPESKHILLPPGASRANPQTMNAQERESPAPEVSSNFPQGHGINYYGGPVVTGTVNLYLIWYGSWSGNAAVPLVTTFMSALSMSRYFNITRSYYDDTLASDGSYSRISGAVRVAGIWYDNYSQGANNPHIIQIVQDAINGRHLSKDTNGVYFVFTSPDIPLSGYGTSYCAYHGSFVIPGTEQSLSYALMGPGSSACTVQPHISPNDNPQGDALVNLIAHELSESVTNRNLAWNSTLGEMADLCAWKFGSEKTAPNGSLYNVSLGGRNYLLQQLWVNDGPGYCALQWPAYIPSNRWFQIVSKNSGLCLTAIGTSSQHGQAMYQESCNVEDHRQQFSFTAANGGYRIIARSNGEALDVRGGPSATGDGVLLQTWPFWGGDNQIFGYSSPGVSGGYGDFMIFNSGRVVSADGSSKLPYAEIYSHFYWGGANQYWKLVPIAE